MSHCVEIIRRGTEGVDLPQGTFLEDGSGDIYILTHILVGSTGMWRAVSLSTGAGWSSCLDDKQKAIIGLKPLPSGSLIEIEVNYE